MTFDTPIGTERLRMLLDGLLEPDAADLPGLLAYAGAFVTIERELQDAYMRLQREHANLQRQYDALHDKLAQMRKIASE